MSEEAWFLRMVVVVGGGGSGGGWGWGGWWVGFGRRWSLQLVYFVIWCKLVQTKSSCWYWLWLHGLHEVC